MVDGIHLRILFRLAKLGRILLPYILDRADTYGKYLENGIRSPNTNKESKKVVVEFSSPNLGREFNGNYFRSTVTGASIAALYEGMGWDVVRLNFLGDWGQHIGLLATGWGRFGSETALGDDPLRHLLDVYTQIDELHKAEVDLLKARPAQGEEDLAALHRPIAEERDALLKAMEDGDPEALALWKRFRLTCIAKYVDLYSRLGINFDEYSGESEISYTTVDEVERILKRKGVYDEGEDAWIIDFSKHPTKSVKSGFARIRTKNDTTTYLLRDIAATIERDREYAFDKMLFVVLANQSAHFQHLFGALELMGYEGLANRLQHVSFADVHGLSPNPGKHGLVFGDILDQAGWSVQEYLHSHPDEYAELRTLDGPEVPSRIGNLALLTESLSVKRKDKLSIDMVNLVDNEQITGARLKTTVTRVRAKAEAAEFSREELITADFSICVEDAYAAILREMLLLPTIVRSAFEKLEPSIVLEYLYGFSELLDGILDAGDGEGQEEEKEEEEKKQEEEEATEAPPVISPVVEAAFYQCALHVLENGMSLIGLAFFEREDADIDNGTLDQAASDTGSLFGADTVSVDGRMETRDLTSDDPSSTMEHGVETSTETVEDAADHRPATDAAGLSLTVSPSGEDVDLLDSAKIGKPQEEDLDIHGSVEFVEEVTPCDVEEAVKGSDAPSVVDRGAGSSAGVGTADTDFDFIETLPGHDHPEASEDPALGDADEEFLKELSSILTATEVEEKSIDGSTDESNDNASAGTDNSTAQSLDIQGIVLGMGKEM